MITYPQVPEGDALEALGATELEALRDAMNESLSLALSGKVKITSPDENDALTAAAADKERIKGEFARRKEVAAADEARLAAVKAALEDEVEDAESVEDPDDVDDDGDVDADDDVDGDGDVDEDDRTEPDEDAAAKAPAKLERVPARPVKGVGAKDNPSAGGLEATKIVALDNVPGHKAGDTYASWADLAAAMLERNRTVGADTVAPMGAIHAKYGSERNLEGLDDMEVLRKLSGGRLDFAVDDLTAAMCAPVTPYYGMDCFSSTARPVFNSLPQFPAPRGGVSIPESPTLSQITGGYGFWDRDDDADVANQTKNACITVACPDSNNFYFYGVYRCMTVQNFMQMTWPEVVEAWLNKLAAATFRAAEAQLLDLMATNTNKITVPGTFTSAVTAIATQLNQYRAGAEERERWDDAGETWQMWAPRWLRAYLKNDIMRRRRTDGGTPRIATDAEVSQIFSDAGFDVTWYLDKPTWGVNIPTQGTGDPVQLVTPPSSVKLLVAPRGKFALIDRGALTIGLQGNNVVRDLDTLKKNQFTMFWETFEGIVDTNSCPADLLTLPLCFQGIQHADQAVDCFGAAEAPS